MNSNSPRGDQAVDGLPKSLLNTLLHYFQEKTWRLAASVTFYVLFAVVPLILFATALAGLPFDREEARTAILRQLDDIVGQQGSAAIKEMMQNYQKPTQGLFSAILGLMALMFGSVNALGQLRDAMNSIWKVKKEQIQERATPVKFLLYFAVTGCVILLLLLSVAFSSALRLVSTNMEGHITTQIQVYKVLNLAGFGAILLLLCLLLYRLLPDLRLKWRSLFFGALLAAVLFSFGKEAFVLYVTRTGIGSAYGALSSIMIFLIWMYLSTQVVLLGAAFAYACEYRNDAS